MNSPFSTFTRPARRAQRRTATPISDALASSDTFAALKEGVARLQALEDDLGACLPDYLRNNVSAAGTTQGVLTLLTPHNALAARLRHLQPKLLNELRYRGWAIDEIRVRIRPAAPPVAVVPKHAQLSHVGLSCLEQLESTLEPSPLRDALERMIARHRG